MTDYMPAPSKEAAATPAGSSSNSETAIEKSGEAGDLLPETLPGKMPTWHTTLGRWLGGQAGTNWDGWLLTVASQIGQILLTLPNAYSKCGLIAGVILTVGCGTISLWTMYLLITLYAERKQRMVNAGLWYGKDGKRHIVTQYHETIGYFLGDWAKYIVQILVIINLFGTNVSQIVASSSDIYYWDSSIDKRTWALIFGGAFQLMIFLPTLRHFRILNILAIIGTTYTVWFIVGESGRHGITPGAASRGPTSLRNFYTGFAVIFNALGGHVVALELMDSMFVPENYRYVYFYSYLYIFSLTIPHSAAVQLAWPTVSLKNGNVFAVVSQYRKSGWLKASIFLMLAHQGIAYALYFLPLAFMVEKLFRVHTKPLPYRILARLPASLLVYFVSVAFPFYGTINSLIGAISSPGVAYIFPTLTYTWTYRKKAARDNMSMKPPRVMLWLGGGGYTFIFCFNIFIAIAWLVNGTGFSLAYSIIQFIDDIKHFAVFSKCYQC